VRGFLFCARPPLFHTVSRKLKFRTVSAVKNLKKETMLNEMNLALALYKSRGFQVVNIHSNMEFECVQHDFLPITLNITPRDAHVGEVERSIRTIKERVRSDIHSMPFKRLPKLMIVELIRRAVMLLNAFPAPDGVSKTLSPRSIMTGKANIDYNSCKIGFVSYALVFEDNDPTNTTKLCSTGAVALNPTGNTEGDYHFMSLTTGRRLSCRQWTAVPMPDAVIAAVEARAEAERQPIIEGGCPHFEWRPNIGLQEDADAGEGHDKAQPEANALALMASTAAEADPMLGQPNPDVIAVPVMNFGAQHPNHDLDPDQQHDEDGSDMSSDDLGPIAVDDGVPINDVVIEEPEVVVLPVDVFPQDAGNQVSDNESVQGDATVGTLSQAEAGILNDSNSTVDVPWDEESQGGGDDSDGISDVLPEENDDIALDANDDASTDGLISDDVPIVDIPQVTQNQRYNLRPSRDWLYSH